MDGKTFIPCPALSCGGVLCYSALDDNGKFYSVKCSSGKCEFRIGKMSVSEFNYMQTLNANQRDEYLLDREEE